MWFRLKRLNVQYNDKNTLTSISHYCEIHGGEKYSSTALLEAKRYWSKAVKCLRENDFQLEFYIQLNHQLKVKITKGIFMHHKVSETKE